jgi:hypothetical protein
VLLQRREVRIGISSSSSPSPIRAKEPQSKIIGGIQRTND